MGGESGGSGTAGEGRDYQLNLIISEDKTNSQRGCLRGKQ